MYLTQALRMAVQQDRERTLTICGDRARSAAIEPAWRTKPSWYQVATDDRMIPPPAQRAMAERAGATVAEAPGSHSIYLSQPQAMANLIKQAAAGAGR
jgi:pimeloyl-ACP methyl ester carboxylesterase